MTASAPVKPGSDLRDQFRRAYETRYTWDPGFSGYRGRCIWQQGEQQVEGRFEVGADLKAKVEGIDDADVQSGSVPALGSGHPPRPPQPVNTAKTGSPLVRPMPLEPRCWSVASEGDRYRIKDDVVTMVHRHIHGTVVTIFTTEVTNTGAGYLSHTYTSQYADPATGEAKGGRSSFKDTFTPLSGDGPWVLTERVIDTEAHGETAAGSQTFRFDDLQAL